MNDSKIKTDWLANNAIIAFFGALLIAQTPQSTDGTTELILGFSIPSIPAWWINSAIALLIAFSLVLILAAYIPPLRRLTLQYATPLLPTLELLTWAAFTTGFAQTLQQLPEDRWWSYPLAYGGLVFFTFLFLRVVYSFATVMWQQFFEKPDQDQHNS